MTLGRRFVLCGLAGGSVWLASGAAWAGGSSIMLDTRENVAVEVSLGDVDVVVRATAAKQVAIVDTSLPQGFDAVLEGNARRVEVKLKGIGVPASGRIELTVPKKARLDVHARNGDVSVHDLEGEADVTVIQGDITVDGSPERVDATTTSGDIRVVGVRDEADLATVSGDVVVSGAGGKLEAGTVSGSIAVTGSHLRRSKLGTVSGAIEFSGSLDAGNHSFAAHSGDIDVQLGPKPDVRIRVESFSGSIVDAFVDPPITVRGRHTRELGDGTARLEVGTFNGDVRLSPTRAG